MLDRITLAASLLISTAFASGCGGVGEDLRRAEAKYDQARYEDALTWLSDIEPGAPSLGREERARYYYLRGMTELRLGNRSNALHYLALAREVTGDRGVGLRDDQRQIMERTLTELTPRDMSHRPPPARETEADVTTAGGESSGESSEDPPDAES